MYSFNSFLKSHFRTRTKKEEQDKEKRWRRIRNTKNSKRISTKRKGLLSSFFSSLLTQMVGKGRKKEGERDRESERDII